MEQELQQILQALLQCIQEHPKGDENKEWFIKLIQDSLNDTKNQEIDEDLIYNATVVENILTNLLAIDIRTIVKIRMVHKTINVLWEENKWDMNLLNSYILNSKPIPQEGSYNNQETINTSHNTPINSEEYSTTIEELPSIEIEMTEENHEVLPIISNSVELQSTSQISTNAEIDNNTISIDIIGKDITDTAQYEFRNRKFELLNPYHVTKNKNYLLGVLAINAPGDSSKERKNFVANSLKLPVNSDLVWYVFWKGNNWIAAGFDFKEDLIFCKNKLNAKENDLVKFIQLSPEDNNDEKESNTKEKIDLPQLPSKENNTQNNYAEASSSKQHIKPIKDTNEKKEQSSQISYKLNNPYNISEKSTIYQGGFLAAKIPGENRKEQLDFISRLLDIPNNNNLITPIFHEGNSWIAMSFSNQEELDNCIITINNQNKKAVKMIALNNNNKKNKIRLQEEKNNKPRNNPIQHQEEAYILTDIPLKLSNNKIKEALKPFRKISNFQVKQKGKWKSASFMI